MENRRMVLVIGGPTGSGESTITKEIIKSFPGVFKRLVTATTRKPRNNEKNAVDYYFFSKNKFLEEIEKGNIIEYTYIKNRDAYYGSYKKDLDKKIKSGFCVIVNPDVVGTKFYKKKFGAISIFIKPDSILNIKKRILKRQPDISRGELLKRIANAKREITKEEKFYDYSVINYEGKIRQTIKKTIGILKKENYVY